ncbi:hypothetical protein T484DRAFT_1920552, partial [Baffinella frigidus]
DRTSRGPRGPLHRRPAPARAHPASPRWLPGRSPVPCVAAGVLEADHADAGGRAPARPLDPRALRPARRTGRPPLTS